MSRKELTRIQKSCFSVWANKILASHSGIIDLRAVFPFALHYVVCHRPTLLVGLCPFHDASVGYAVNAVKRIMQTIAQIAANLLSEQQIEL